MPDSYSARAIVWPRPGVTEIADAVEVPAPADGELTIEVAVSVVSSGTERARYLALPNATVGFPHVPGYLASGRVLHGTADLPAGTRVAARGVTHQSVVNVDRAELHPIPDGIGDEDAALWQFALTAMHGLSMGRHEPGEPVTVVGAGLLGTVARRIAAARGSACTAVARSDAKSGPAGNEPGTSFVLADDVAADAHKRSPLVVDVTGTADGLTLALSAASDGGRVVVLGSPRAAVAPLQVAEIHRRGLRVIGAHIDTLEESAARAGRDLVAEFTEEFFGLLASGSLSFGDFLTAHDPNDAAFLYRSLVSDRSIVGAYFDWRETESAGDRQESGDERPAMGGPGTTEPMRFAVFGCGDIGAQDAYALASAEGASLSVCFDPHEALAKDVADRYGAEVARSVDEALAREDVDAVIIATPHDTHEELAVAAMNAGKHVLLQKPLSAGLASARRIAEAAERSAVTSGVLFPLRYHPGFVQARAGMAAGVVGPPLAAVSTYLVHKPPSYFYGGYSNRAASTWRLSKERSGGGVLIMNLLHHIDAVRALLGVEADSVYAQTVPSDVAPEIEDVAGLVVRFGTTVATFVAGAQVTQGPGESLRVWGATGHAEVLPDAAVSSLLTVPDGVRTAPYADEDLTAAAIADFVAAVRAGAPAPVSVGDALAVQEIVEAGYESARSGLPVVPASLTTGATR
ncbi:Gfo/Idh/MocA family oxidoreductase [Streptomyces sp. NPDC057521]|uniref:Gfo/Idh/MocA family oxidoreductase n=1 Tax=Streptomyces sp. NPDC057521 TaxID=3346156 RepID=UPI0036824677